MHFRGIPHSHGKLVQHQYENLARFNEMTEILQVSYQLTQSHKHNQQFAFFQHEYAERELKLQRNIDIRFISWRVVFVAFLDNIEAFYEFVIYIIVNIKKEPAKTRSNTLVKAQKVKKYIENLFKVLFMASVTDAMQVQNKYQNLLGADFVTGMEAVVLLRQEASAMEELRQNNMDTPKGNEMKKVSAKIDLYDNIAMWALMGKEGMSWNVTKREINENIYKLNNEVVNLYFRKKKENINTKALRLFELCLLCLDTKSYKQLNEEKLDDLYCNEFDEIVDIINKNSKTGKLNKMTLKNEFEFLKKHLLFPNRQTYLELTVSQRFEKILDCVCEYGALSTIKEIYLFITILPLQMISNERLNSARTYIHSKLRKHMSEKFLNDILRLFYSKKRANVELFQKAYEIWNQSEHRNVY